MDFSLITAPWLSVRFKDGSSGKAAPVDLADENIVDVVSNRADLQGAAWQFLIGLLQTALAPQNREAWRDVWDDGLSAESVQQALLPLEEAFLFGEQSPAFMQDYETISGEGIDIVQLLPETPGEQTRKLNKDHFIKRDVTTHFCPHCAALALFSLQLNAPSGGKGYRTGLRGGGPMTTLVDLQADEPLPLWRRLWVNVMPQQESTLPLPTKYDEAVFPWLGSTRTSEKNQAITPAQVNPLQAYWGMPRRIRIDFAQQTSGCCHLCGVESENLLSQMRVKNYGTNYTSWFHPLTPYRKPNKEGGEAFSLKAQPGGLLWKDWLGLNLAVSMGSNQEEPAEAVRQFAANKPRNVVTGLWCFGYDFDNMKARCWYEHRFPFLHLDGTRRRDVVPTLQNETSHAAKSLSTLRSALKEAWSDNPKGDFSFIDIDFWHRTQASFFTLVSALEQGEDRDAALAQWRRTLWRFICTEFDTRTQTNPYDSVDLARVMKARRKYFSRSLDKQNARPRRGGKQEAQ